MDYQVKAIYEKGLLRLLEPLDLPDHTQLTVTVSVAEADDQPRFCCPTRPQPLSLLAPLIGMMPVGGDAVKDTEALYDQDW